MSTKNQKYFGWIVLHVLAWVGAISVYITNVDQEYWRLLSLAGYFIGFFLIPLFVDKTKVIVLFICMMILSAIVTVYPSTEPTFNPFIMLILAMVTSEMAYRLPWRYNVLPALLLIAGLSLLSIMAEHSFLMHMFLLIYVLLLFSGAIIYSWQYGQLVAIRARYDALLTEFRSLKRRLNTEEALVRQEERKLIGHEIHDSVGHKLTALIMQLESFRLRAEEQQHDQSHVLSLKKLAQDSLEETRKAVQAFKYEDTSGSLHGIIRLIRNLESDSFLRVRFTVDHGAFGAPLSGEQSFVIYRSVQEALTNIMKHSKAREAQIVFEMPGGSVFRFEITNPVTHNVVFQEGFGLSSMRERLQNIGGDLDVYSTADLFVVRGWLRLVEWRDVSD